MKTLAITLIATLALVCAGCKDTKPHRHHPQPAKVIHRAPPPKGYHKAPPPKALPPKPLPPKGKPLPPPKH